MNYHFIGICGSSMSGLYRVMKEQGHSVSGCDLLQKGGHSEKHISKNLDGVIISAAITSDSKAWPEVEKAQKMGIPVITRSKLIGKLMQDKIRTPRFAREPCFPRVARKIGIAVSGSHGKTTTSAMITLILKEAGLDPTYFIGGEIKKLSNAGLGKGEYLVAEACEYDRQFLDFRPKIAVITNIDKEHLDTYPGGLTEIKKAFKKFIKLLPKNGILVLNEDDPAFNYLKKVAKCKVKTFSASHFWPGLSLKIPGKHNLLNATAAARVCHEIDISHQIIKRVLNNFEGVSRRFEIKGKKDGVIVVDDYAHHPTEIKATLFAAREFFPKKRIICVFQPHQYLRTEALFGDFASAFSDCDILILAEIFKVEGRDPETPKIKTKDLAEAIKKSSQKNVIYLPTYDKIIKYLKKEAKNGDLIITLGATKIYKIGERFLCKN